MERLVDQTGSKKVSCRRRFLLWKFFTSCTSRLHECRCFSPILYTYICVCVCMYISWELFSLSEGKDPVVRELARFNTFTAGRISRALPTALISQWCTATCIVASYTVFQTKLNTWTLPPSVVSSIVHLQESTETNIISRIVQCHLLDKEDPPQLVICAKCINRQWNTYFCPVQKMWTTTSTPWIGINWTQVPNWQLKEWRSSAKINKLSKAD